MRRILLLICLVASATVAVADRILPVDPELSNVDAATGQMTFYCPGATNGAAHELVATVLGRSVRAPLDSEKRATLSLGKLPRGRHQVSLRLQDAATGRVVVTNAYPIRAVQPIPMPAGAKRLNNFVTELGSFAAKNGKISFVNPRDGWVHLRGDSFAVFRYLKRGPCETEVPVPSCTVRLVKPIVHGGFELADGLRPDTVGPFSEDFHRKWVYGLFNVIEKAEVSKGASSPVAEEIGATGARLTTSFVRMRAHDRKIRSDIDAMVGLLENAAGRGDIVIDEMSLTLDGDSNRNFGEACWRFIEKGHDEAFRTCWCDVIDNVIEDPSLVASAFSSSVNSGGGTGFVATEHYLCARTDSRAAKEEVERVVDFSKSVRRMMPCAPRHVIYLLGTYLFPGDWNAWCSPETDMKALLARYLHRLATDPEFADVGGIGVPRFYCDEEIARFICQAVRHYCLEGRTDDFAAAYGYRYRPGLLSNGDFDRGFEGWTACPAAAESLTVGTREKFGRKEQGRIGGGASGDRFALFTRQTSKPNVLTYAVKGLKPGRMYALTYLTADYDDVLKPGRHPLSETLRATVSNAVVVPERSYTMFWPPERFPSGRRPKSAVTVSHKVVFCATADSAEIAFTDWLSPEEPGGHIGGRRILNGVGVRPYFTEGKGIEVR